MNNVTEPPEQQPKIETDGGAIVDGNVDIQAGDFVGRDKIINLLANIPAWLMWTLAAGIGIIALSVTAGLGGIYFVISATPTPTATPTVTPTPLPTLTPTATATPAKMGGNYNIVVAQFDEVDSQGKRVAGEAGHWLSGWLAQALSSTLSSLDGFEIWHDDGMRPPSNPPIGVLDDAGAEKLLDEQQNIGANFVIYGQLVHDTGPPTLQLKFAYRAKSVRGEPDATLGFQRLGAAIPVVGIEEGSYREQIGKDEELAIRIRLLIWLVRGLSFDLHGDYEDALTLFEEAVQAVQKWEEEHSSLLHARALAGKEILFYFQGRTLLTLKQFTQAEAAFTQAITLNDTYASPWLGRGNVYFDGVQFYLLSQQATAGDLSACLPNLSLSAVISQPLVPRTEEAARVQLDKAHSNYQQALNLVGTEERSLLSALLQGMMARIELTLAEFDLKELDRAQPDVDATQRQAALQQHLTQAAQGFEAALPVFVESRKLDYLAFVRYNLGLVHLHQAELAQKQADQASAETYYQQAKEQFQACYAQPSPLAEAGFEPLEKQISCYCRYWENKVLDVIGGSG